MLTVSVTTGTDVTTLVVYDSIRLTRDCDPQRTDRGMIDSSIGWSMRPYTGLRVSRGQASRV